MEMKDILVVMGNMVLILGFYVMINVILEIIGNWNMFSKAGEAGWKSIVPFLNEYTCFDLYWKKEMFWPYMVLMVLTSMTVGDNQLIAAMGILSAVGLMVIAIKLALGMSRCHGMSIGMAVVMLLCPGLGAMILGCGKSKYRKII